MDFSKIEPPIATKEQVDKLLANAKARNIKKAREFYAANPFANKIYLVMQTRLSQKFVQDNWEEITKGL